MLSVATMSGPRNNTDTGNVLDDLPKDLKNVIINLVENDEPVSDTVHRRSINCDRGCNACMDTCRDMLFDKCIDPCARTDKKCTIVLWAVSVTLLLIAIALIITSGEFGFPYTGTPASNALFGCAMAATFGSLITSIFAICSCGPIDQ